jgi:2-haloacid dehalogenase
MPQDGIILAFDVYGTLLSTESIAKQLAEHFGEDKATSIAAEWRKYQLEYTWRLNSMRTFTTSYQMRRCLPHITTRKVYSLLQCYSQIPPARAR